MTTSTSNGAEFPPGARHYVSTLGAVGAGLAVIGLVLLCLSGQWQHIAVPVPVDRMLIAIGTCLAVVAYATGRRRLALRPVHVWMAIALACVGLSATWHDTLDGEGVFALLDRFGLIPFLMFACAPVLFGTWGARQFLARAFTVFCLYLSAVSVAQVMGFDPLVWPRYILDPSVGLHPERARGPYAEAVANGLMLIFSAALSAVTAVLDRSRRWRVVGILAIPLAAVSVLLTLTRSVWAAALAAAGLSAIFVPALRRWALPLGVLSAGSVLFTYVAVPGFSELATSRGSDQWPLWDRLNTNWAAVRMLLDNPLTGVGWTRSDDVMVEYIRQGSDYPVTTASARIEIHNVFLSRLAELGLVGATPWAAALGAAIAFPLIRRPETAQLQPWRAALLVTAVAWSVAALFGPVPYPQPNYMLWLLGGVVLSEYLQCGRGTECSRTRSGAATAGGQAA